MAFISFSAVMIKYPDNSSLAARGVILVHNYQVIIHYSMEVAEAGLEIAAYIHKWEERVNESIDAYAQLTVSFVYTLGSEHREWCCPQWQGLPTPMWTRQSFTETDTHTQASLIYTVPC